VGDAGLPNQSPRGSGRPRSETHTGAAQLFLNRSRNQQPSKQLQAGSGCPLRLPKGGTTARLMLMREGGSQCVIDLYVEGLPPSLCPRNPDPSGGDGANTDESHGVYSQPISTAAWILRDQRFHRVPSVPWPSAAGRGATCLGPSEPFCGRVGFLVCHGSFASPGTCIAPGSVT
jgi:hypothetical protein